MIGGAAQRQRKTRKLQTRQNQVKPHRILGSKPACQQVLARVIKVELGLHTGKIGPVVSKGQYGFFKLQRIGNILGVVDYYIRAFSREQAIIASSRLGARLSIGDHNDFEMRGQVQSPDHFASFAIVLFRQEKNL